MPKLFLSKKIKITLISAVSFLALYAVLGFLILPAVLNDQIPKIAKEQINRHIEIADIQFNPFSLEFSIEGFQLHNLDKSDFVTFKKFYLNIAVLRSLFDLSLHIDQVLLDSPNVAIIRSKQGLFNFDDLSSSEEEPEQDKSTQEKKELFPVSIAKIDLITGNIGWEDNMRSASHQANVHPLTLHITDFITKAHKNSQLGVTLDFASGGSLTWQGDIKVTPFESNGHIELNNLKLNKVWQLFLADSVNFAILQGYEKIKADYQLKLSDDSTQLIINNAEVAIHELKIAESLDHDAVIDLGDFILSGISFNLLKQSVEINKVSSNNSHFDAWLNADGTVNYQSLFAPKASSTTKEETTSPDAPAQAPWNIQVNELAINNYSLNFTDKTVSPAAKIDLTAINVQSSGLSNKEDAVLPVNLDFIFNNKGKLKLSSKTSLSPLSSELDLSLKDITLRTFQPYVNRVARLNIISGLFNVDANISLQEEQDKPLSITFTGNTHIDKLITRDTISNNDFIKWKKLSLSKIDVDTAKNTHNIDTIKLDKLYSRVLIRKDKSINVNDILIQPKKSKQKPVAKKAPKQSPTHFKVAKFLITNSSADFSDLSLILPFSAHLTQLNGAVKGISSKKNAEYDINLDGRVANISPVIIKGTITPESGDSEFTLDFNSMPLPLITPYMADFAGRKIEKGNMTLGLQYKIKDKQLAASNNLLIEHLVLGEEVENPDAVSLPLGLAIALLEDSEGNIALDVPVTGDLDNPELSVATLVFDALANVITKIVASPFNAIASLLGSDADISKVIFTAGKTGLSTQQKENLDILTVALFERPALSLEIKGTAFSNQDWPALQSEALTLQLTQLKVNELNKKNKHKVLLEHTKLNEEEYQDYLATLFIETFPKLAERSIFGTPKLKNPEMGEFYSVAQDKLAKRIPPNSHRLQKLARARAESIAEYLITKEIPIKRIFLLDVSAEIKEAPENLIATTLSLTAQ
ncbi:MAG: DUF748 domain-containing protein [Methyloprofundus sp.]|nr:DUF748 domain-containing protein [Methyloprofundus sp.]